jgi:RNA polymerase sigma factor (sigma-70 family)
MGNELRGTGSMASAHVDVATPGTPRRAGAGVEGMLDEQLLERFIARREEAAFEALVVRHGPRVLGVCRQVLGDSEDTHDAFQATFLVLVRKAGAIRKRGSLGPWLYGVARRIAVRAKVRDLRRREQERRFLDMPVERTNSEIDQRELRPVLDEEMSRLPEKYRLPVMLCYLQGMTNEEAAKRLKCPPGTLKGRLSRAREILRERLARRGVVLGGGLMLWLASSNAANAATAVKVPVGLVSATVKSSMLVVAAKGKLASVSSLSPNVAAMVEDALRSLFRASALRLATGALSVAAIVGSVGVISSSFSFQPLVADTKLNLNQSPPTTSSAACGDNTGSPVTAYEGHERPRRER